MANNKKITEVFTEEEIKNIIHNLADYQICNLCNNQDYSEKEAVEETVAYTNFGFTEEQVKYLKTLIK